MLLGLALPQTYLRLRPLLLHLLYVQLRLRARTKPWCWLRHPVTPITHVCVPREARPAPCGTATLCCACTPSDRDAPPAPSSFVAHPRDCDHTITTTSHDVTAHTERINQKRNNSHHHHQNNSSSSTHSFSLVDRRHSSVNRYVMISRSLFAISLASSSRRESMTSCIDAATARD